MTGLSPAGFWARDWEFGYAKGVFAAAQLFGTAVRPLRDDHIIQTPTMVLTLDA